MGLYQLAKNNRVVQKIYEPVKRRFRGQEPVYYLFDSVVRPFFSWLILKSARARFAILTLCDDILFENQSKGQERVSEETIKRFGASDYHYGDQQLDTGIPIEQRLSGQILPILEPLLAIPDVKIVLEIGCGNGLIAERLARQHPNMKFIGIDFAVPKSSPGRFPDNLEFRAGYALDLLEPEQFPVSPDVVYFQFTATKFLPREILGYFAKFRKLGVRFVALSEPTRKNYPIKLNEDDTASKYLDGRIWKHDYSGIARANGYYITDFRFQHWSELIEKRFNRARLDSYIVRMAAELRTQG